MSDRYESGIYDDPESAQEAVGRLHDLGYSNDEISVIMKDKERARDFAEHTGSKAGTGAAIGATIGGGLGAILAGLTATGSVAAVVGTGGVAAPLVVGPLAAALAGLGAAGAAGGILGALIGAGIPEHRAKQYEERLNNGGLLLVVEARPDNRDRLREIFPYGDEAATIR